MEAVKSEGTARQPRNNVGETRHGIGPPTKCTKHRTQNQNLERTCDDLPAHMHGAPSLNPPLVLGLSLASHILGILTLYTPERTRILI